MWRLSTAIDRRVRAYFRVSISAVPGVAGISSRGRLRGGWGPNTLQHREAQGVQPADRGKGANRDSGKPMPSPALPKGRRRRHQEVSSQDQTSAQPSAAPWALLLEGSPPSAQQAVWAVEVGKGCAPSPPPRILPAGAQAPPAPLSHVAQRCTSVWPLTQRLGTTTVPRWGGGGEEEATGRTGWGGCQDPTLPSRPNS